MMWLINSQVLWRKLWEARFDRLAAYLKHLQARAAKDKKDKEGHD